MLQGPDCFLPAAEVDEPLPKFAFEECSALFLCEDAQSSANLVNGVWRSMSFSERQRKIDMSRPVVGPFLQYQLELVYCCVVVL